MKNNYIISKTEKEPYIKLDKSGKFQLGGICIPENAPEFFKDALHWLLDYSDSPKSNTVFEIRLDYFNTSSASIILNILQLLNELHDDGKSNVTIHWFCEEGDYSMIESAEDYAAMFNMEFKIHEVLDLHAN